MVSTLPPMSPPLTRTNSTTTTTNNTSSTSPIQTDMIKPPLTITLSSASLSPAPAYSPAAEPQQQQQHRPLTTGLSPSLQSLRPFTIIDTPATTSTSTLPTITSRTPTPTPTSSPPSPIRQRRQLFSSTSSTSLQVSPSPAGRNRNLLYPPSPVSTSSPVTNDRSLIEDVRPPTTTRPSSVNFNANSGRIGGNNTQSTSVRANSILAPSVSTITRELPGSGTLMKETLTTIKLRYDKAPEYFRQERPDELEALISNTTYSTYLNTLNKTLETQRLSRYKDLSNPLRSTAILLTVLFLITRSYPSQFPSIISVPVYLTSLLILLLSYLYNKYRLIKMVLVVKRLVKEWNREMVDTGVNIFWEFERLDEDGEDGFWIGSLVRIFPVRIQFKVNIVRYVRRRISFVSSAAGDGGGDGVGGDGEVQVSYEGVIVEDGVEVLVIDSNEAGRDSGILMGGGGGNVELGLLPRYEPPLENVGGDAGGISENGDLSDDDVNSNVIEGSVENEGASVSNDVGGFMTNNSQETRRLSSRLSLASSLRTGVPHLPAYDEVVNARPNG
ncbi:hypothetical protein HDU76_006464 [Blyttiomyces sp. JEL0837]|nr:hypothetical protein HDU76_006464 [Blyttiomyces sp. JEL0837]